MIIYFGLVGFCESNSTLGQVEINAGMGAQYQHESVLSNFPFKANVGVGYIVEKMYLGFDLDVTSSTDTAEYSQWRYHGSPSSGSQTNTSTRFSQRITHSFLGLNGRIGSIAANKEGFKCILGISLNYYTPLYQRYDPIYIVENTSTITTINVIGGSSSSSHSTSNDSLLTAQSALLSGFFSSLRFKAKERLWVQFDITVSLLGRNQTIRHEQYSYHSELKGSRSYGAVSLSLIRTFKPKDSNPTELQTE